MDYLRYATVLGHKGYDVALAAVEAVERAEAQPPTVRYNDRRDDHDGEAASPASEPPSWLQTLWDNVAVLVATEMSEVDRGVYVGSSFDAASARALAERGITHVVNATPHLPDFFAAEGVQYLRVAVGDTHQDRVCWRAFDAAADFIRDAVAGGGRVLVHCMMGRSRSVAVACHYLRRERGARMREAYAQVRARRPCANINMNFYTALVAADAPGERASEHERAPAEHERAPAERASEHERAPAEHERAHTCTAKGASQHRHAPVTHSGRGVPLAPPPSSPSP